MLWAIVPAVLACLPAKVETDPSRTHGELLSCALDPYPESPGAPRLPEGVPRATPFLQPRRYRRSWDLGPSMRAFRSSGVERPRLRSLPRNLRRRLWAPCSISDFRSGVSGSRCDMGANLGKSCVNSAKDQFRLALVVCAIPAAWGESGVTVNHSLTRLKTSLQQRGNLRYRRHSPDEVRIAACMIAQRSLAGECRCEIGDDQRRVLLKRVRARTIV
jgi:hypothetical protein